MVRALLLFLLVVFLALRSSNAQKWFEATPLRFFNFGGNIAKIENDNTWFLVCGVDAIGGSHLIYYSADNNFQEFLNPLSSDGPLPLGSTFPIAGESCSISVDSIGRAVAWNGIATNDGSASCRQSTSIAFLGEIGILNPVVNMNYQSTIATFGTRAGAVAAQRFFMGDEKTGGYETFFFFSGISTNVSLADEVPCQGIYNPPNNKRATQLPYRFDIYMAQYLQVASPPVLNNYRPLFAINDPRQGLAHSAILFDDFNQNALVDMFVCGTVFNTDTTLDEPYTQVNESALVRVQEPELMFFLLRYCASRGS